MERLADLVGSESEISVDRDLPDPSHGPMTNMEVDVDLLLLQVAGQVSRDVALEVAVVLQQSFHALIRSGQLLVGKELAQLELGGGEQLGPSGAIARDTVNEQASHDEIRTVRGSQGH